MYWEKEKEVVEKGGEEEGEEEEARHRAEREPSTRSNAAGIMRSFMQIH